MTEIRVWDIPVRVFHWALVVLVGTAWVTAENGWLEVHEWTGYSILTLVVFRLLWGLFGSENARFTRFLTPPRVAVQHLKQTLQRRAPHFDTHNPAGGWMVVGLLLSLLVQAGTGLFSHDDVLFEGPLAGLVSTSTSSLLTEIHHINFNVLLTLVGLHVLAVAWHEWQGERIVKAMWFGRKPSNASAAPQRPLWVGVVLLAVSAAAVWGLLSLAPKPSFGF